MIHIKAALVFALFFFGSEHLIRTMVWQSQSSQSDPVRGMRPVEYAVDLTRRLLGNRPKRNQTTTRKSGKYLVVSNKKSRMEPGRLVGITLWKLSPAQTSDDPTITEEQPPQRTKKKSDKPTPPRLVPKRFQSDAALADGDLIRISLEAPEGFFIYILNRERYVDGKVSLPYLIFPGVSDVGQNDAGKVGKQLFFPSPHDCFEIEQVSEAHLVKTGEELIFILSPVRLGQLPPLADNQPRAVDAALFSQWIKEWTTPTWQFENQATPGATITRIEQSATLTAETTLTDDAPLPQSVFHVKSHPGQPLLFTLPLTIRKP